MFGIGMPEMLLILAVALIVIGPKKLPDLAKSLGRALGEFKKAASDLKDTITTETDLSNVRKEFQALNQDLRMPAEQPEKETAADKKTDGGSPPSGGPPQDA